MASLRDLIPPRPLQFSEALRIAELQALRLLELTGVSDGPVPTEIVSELPRIAVLSRAIPTSGLSYWDGQRWLIALNRSEPVTRQRFNCSTSTNTLSITARPSCCTATTSAEPSRAADYFAGCTLLPRTLLKRAWARGVQRPSALATLFDVSERAAAVRLAQVGLSDPIDRCRILPPYTRRPHAYYGSCSMYWPRVTALKIAS